MSVSEYIRGRLRRDRRPPNREALTRQAERSVVFRLLRLLKNRPSLPPIQATDLRSVGPTHACVCGCTVFLTYAQFEDYEICWYALDVECANCGNLLKAPCPVDKPEFEQ